MPIRFFPLHNMNEVMDRYELILSEFHTWLPDTVPVIYLMQLSDRASAIKEAKRNAAKEGKIYVG